MTTYHALYVARDRFGYKADKTDRFVQLAFRNGRRAKDYKAKREKSWLARHCRDGCEAVAYNGKCLIFSGSGDCVTMYDLPQWWGKPNHGYEANRKKQPVIVTI